MVTELAVDILGADAPGPDRPPAVARVPDRRPGAPNSSASWVGTFLNARAGTIYAGSSQIQRNIIGEMILGLPKEPRPADAVGRDRSPPWPPGPRCGATAVRQMRRTMPPRAGGGGDRRSCRVPSAEYLRFRHGHPVRRRRRIAPEPADVVNYLRWCVSDGGNVRQPPDDRWELGRVRTMRSALVLNASLRAAQRRVRAPRRLPRARRQGRCHRGRRHELHSASLARAEPVVIRLRYMVKVPYHRRTALSRRAVFARDDHRCQYCGEHADSIDHVMPRSRGGQHKWENVAAACRPCNLHQARPHARRGRDAARPSVPGAAGDGVGGRSVSGIPDTWKPYLPLAS